jgi:hypothetical protein
MSIKKKNYKIVEVHYGYTTKYTVQKKFLWFFWKTIKNNAGYDMEYTTKRGAQAYINFLK